MMDLLLGAFLVADSVYVMYYAWHENAPFLFPVAIILMYVGTLITRRYFHG